MWMPTFQTRGRQRVLETAAHMQHSYRSVTCGPYEGWKLKWHFTNPALTYDWEWDEVAFYRYVMEGMIDHVPQRLRLRFDLWFPCEYSIVLTSEVVCDIDLLDSAEWCEKWSTNLFGRKGTYSELLFAKKSMIPKALKFFEENPDEDHVVLESEPRH